MIGIFANALCVGLLANFATTNAGTLALSAGKRYPIQIDATQPTSTCAIRPLLGDSGVVTIRTSSSALLVTLRLPNDDIITPESALLFGCTYTLVDRTGYAGAPGEWLWPFAEDRAPGVASHIYALPPTLVGPVRVVATTAAALTSPLPAIVEYRSASAIQLFAAGVSPVAVVGRPFPISVGAIAMGAQFGDVNSIAPISKVRSVASLPSSGVPWSTLVVPTFVDDGLLGDATAGDNV